MPPLSRVMTAGFSFASLLVDKPSLMIPAILTLLVVGGEYAFQFVQVVKEEETADDL